MSVLFVVSPFSRGNCISFHHHLLHVDMYVYLCKCVCHESSMQFFAKGLACCFSLYKSAYGKKCAIYESCVAKTWRVWDFDTLITQVLLKHLNVPSTLMIMYLNSYMQRVINFNPIPINCKTLNLMIGTRRKQNIKLILSWRLNSNSMHPNLWWMQHVLGSWCPSITTYKFVIVDSNILIQMNANAFRNASFT
jgi:hypothetical protein